jgi:hypothetical protein
MNCNTRVIRVGIQGPPGIPGPPGGGSPLALLPALADLSALRIVSRNGAGYSYSSPDSAESVWAIAGLTQNAVNTGSSFIPLRNTSLFDNSWNWVRGAPIFLGPNGALTQTPPSSGYLVVVAKVLDPKTIFIQIEEPIDL